MDKEEQPCKLKDNAVLIEEGVSWFNKLLEDFNEKFENAGEIDYLSLVIHGFMLELGFSSDDCSLLPQKCKSKAGFTFKYSFPPDSNLEVILNVTSLGPSVTKIYGTHIPSKVTLSTSRIKPDQFVLKNHHTPEFKNLSQLARIFKNDVGVPLLNSLKRHRGLPTSGLEGLPPEIIFAIFKHFDVATLLNVSLVSKTFNLCSKDKNLWKLLCMKLLCKWRFEMEVSNLSEDINWYSLFKQHYLNKKKIETGFKKIEDRIRGPCLHPPIFPFPDPESNPEGPPPFPQYPGIVGGDYDLNPLGGLLGRNPFQRLPRPRFDPPGPGFGGGSGSYFGGGGGFY